VTNGGFEVPQVVGEVPNAATGWGGNHILTHSPTSAHSGNQFASLSTAGGSITQTLNTSGLLVGDTLTVTFFHDDTVAASLGASTVTTPTAGNLEYRSQSLSYTLTADAESVTLEIARATGSPFVDDVSANCVRPEPTSTPTETPSPTLESTVTPSPTSEPTKTPNPTTGDASITVTGDPRFPVAGTAATGEPGLTYSLENEPDQGNVVVQPDGAFTYTADSYLVTFDQFTVLASDGTTITVNVVLEIDPSIPTYGEVKPGGTGNGGTVDEVDARNPSNPTSPNPTTVPDQDDSDDNDGDSCSRCN
jgi:hypothetical protein